MKRLTTTCVSTILHLRKIFPEVYFKTENFEGVTVKILKSGEGYKYLDKIEKWLQGAFEAIDKKYVRFHSHNPRLVFFFHRTRG